MRGAPDACRLLSLFGLATDSEQLQTLWAELNTLHRPTPPSPAERRHHDWVLVRRKGVELGFVDEAYQTGAPRDRWGRGPMVLSQLYFHAGSGDVRRYEGELPFGLRWEDDRSTARGRLSAHESTRHSCRTDTWDVPGYRLTVVYAEEGAGLARVTCRRMPAPIASDAASDAPRLPVLTAALGTSMDGAAFAALWGAGGWTADHLEAAREDGDVDLNAPFGLTFRALLRGKAPLLRSVTLHRNGDEAGSGWRGELPCGLDFEDSPEALFAKLEVPPIRQSDSALTGHGVWQLDAFTLHVLYSHVDNRLLRVTLIAPELWA